MEFIEWYEMEKESLTTMSLQDKLRRAWKKASSEGYTEGYDAGSLDTDGYSEGYSDEMADCDCD